MTIDVQQEGRVRRITLNRPEKRNALNLQLCRELVTALDEADADPGTGAILLAGSGKAFCAGMDLEEILDADTGAIDAVHEQLFTAGRRLATPIVAAVHGAALAGGTGLVANCHVVVAAEEATFGLTEIRIGLWPFVIFRAVAGAIGERRATELSLTGRIFGAAEALSFGLAHYVVPAAELELRAAGAARLIAAWSAAAVRSGLEFVREGATGEAARGRREELFRGAEFRARVRDFLEKRNKSH